LEALAKFLEAKGFAPSGARAAAGRALRHVFAKHGQWNGEGLTEAGIGRWAHDALLSLQTEPGLVVAERAPAADGAKRLLLSGDGGALIESVIIPGPRRTTLCVSTQVGCARACSFCETGRLGLGRQLGASEIVDQVRVARGELSSDAPELRNVVFMGMGEPLDNLENVARAASLLTDSRAFAFAPSHLTVSTVGGADKLEAFFKNVPAELALSLNAPDDERRDRIMPINKRFPLATLKEALIRALPKGRRVFVEYVLFDGFNDAPSDADLVAAWTRGLRCRVNVIPANPGPDPDLRAPSPERVDAFVARLASRGVTTLVRRPRGRDVGGACGQLAGAARP
jgi:23S rRNA (adenine2503-C2)-methyltransferase